MHNYRGEDGIAYLFTCITASNMQLFSIDKEILIQLFRNNLSIFFSSKSAKTIFYYSLLSKLGRNHLNPSANPKFLIMNPIFYRILLYDTHM